MRALPVTEFDVEALVDSQLSWEEEKHVLQEVQRNPALLRHYTQIVAQKKLLIAWWQRETGRPPSPPPRRKRVDA
jgi:hypothetical protein